MKEKKTEKRRSIREVLAVLRKYNISSKSDVHSIRLALEELGPTFVKLGQLIATQSSFFPPELCDELRGLRDEVTPMTPEQVDQVLFEAFGRSKEEVFAYFDEDAHGSASISQVHHARLHTGEDVAVKIQRIGAKESMDKDIAFLRRLVKKIPFLKNIPYIDLSGMLDELQEITNRELDFTCEAANLERFHELNKDVKSVTCPAVFKEYTTKTVLTMEYVDGINIAKTDVLKEKGYDLNEIGRKYVHSYLKQVFTDGFFQADPHTGNIKIRGGQIVWYDLGMVGELSEREREDFIGGAESLVTGDVSGCYDAFCRMCSFSQKYDKEKFYKDVEDVVESVSSHGLENLDINSQIQRLMRIAENHHARVAPSNTMIARGIATVQGTLDELFPELNFFEELKVFAIELKLSEIKEKRGGDKDVEMLKKHLKMKKIKQIPANIAGMIDTYSKGLTPIKIEMGVPEKSQPFIEDIVKMLVDSFIIVALLISSSIIVMSKLKPLVWGMPALGFAGYTLSIIMILVNFFRRLRK